MRRDILVKLHQLDALLKQFKEQKQLTPDEVQALLQRIEDEIMHISAEAEEVERSTVVSLARRRAIVLSITVLIELAVAFAISPFEKTISQFAALYVFSPLVSAVSGNHGLQTAAIIIRAISVGTLQNKVRAVIREVLTGLLCGLIVGLFAGVVAFWVTKLWIAIPVITLSLLAGMATSGFMGATIPQVAKWFGLDPAIVAGPAETALQDLASYFTFLFTLTMLSKLLL